MRSSQNSKRKEPLANRPRSRKPDLPRRRMTESKENDEDESGIGRESVSVILCALGVFLVVALHSKLSGHVASWPFSSGETASGLGNTMGLVGEVVADSLVDLLGWCSLVSVLLAFVIARTIWCHGWPKASGALLGVISSIAGSVVMIASCAALVSVFYGYDGGGRIGSAIAYRLVDYVNEPGALLISFVFLMLSFGFGTGIATSKVLSSSYSVIRWMNAGIADVGFLVRSILGVIIKSFWWFGCKFSRVLSRLVQILLKDIYSVSSRLIRRIGPLFQRSPGVVDSDESSVAIDSGSEEEPFVLGIGRPVKRRKESRERGEPKDTAIRISRGGEPTIKTSRRLAKKGKRKERRLVAGNAQNTGASNNVQSFESGIEYQKPSIDLLISGEEDVSSRPNDGELFENSKRLEQTLKDFRIGGRIIEVQPGPIVTLYQFQPAAGVKVQRIVSLADDLALSLKVESVRVYAPVPGKGTVGIEVPNAEREIVRLRSIFDNEIFRSVDCDLVLALGKDTFGDPYVADLGRMPHLLIAGATGTGKSVCINSLLLSLLYRNTPDTLRLILIDPKMLELSMYEDIPHLKAPVVTNPKRARGVLWWAVEEMDRRYELMKDLGVRNLAGYNSVLKGSMCEDESSEELTDSISEDRAQIELGEPKANFGQSLSKNGSASKTPEHVPLPSIVIVVDEFADLMLTVGREIEELITRLAQKARAAGIHLILATQRPSVNVITGLIKANFPARISFQVATRIDSRTVLDTSGSEKLLGRGDMLFMPPGIGRLKRLHAPFVSDEEVRNVANWIKKQGAPRYDTDIEKMVERLEDTEGAENGQSGADEYDALYDQAVAMVCEKGHASTSMVQRVFRIGYNRAARILETMERDGVVGPADGAKPRKILVSKLESL